MDEVLQLLTVSLSAQEPARKRTKAEIMEEVMAKSKAYKVRPYRLGGFLNGADACDSSTSDRRSSLQTTKLESPSMPSSRTCA